MDLSIITATIPERSDSLRRVSYDIARQSEGLPVEHVIVRGDGTVGRKMSKGFRRAKGLYVCVVDDDDEISSDYVESLLREIAYDPDVVTFLMQTPGSPPWRLHASVPEESVEREGPAWRTIRPANHLCAWRRGLAASAPCVPRNYGWDVVWYRALRAAHPHLYERHVPRVLYHYLYSPEGTRAQSRESVADSQDCTGAKISIYQLPEDGRLVAGPETRRLWDSECVIHDYSDHPGLVLLEEIQFK